jgi:hypothetical protein
MIVLYLLLVIISVKCITAERKDSKISKAAEAIAAAREALTRNRARIMDSLQLRKSSVPKTKTTDMVRQPSLRHDLEKSDHSPRSIVRTRRSSNRTKGLEIHNRDNLSSSKDSYYWGDVHNDVRETSLALQLRNRLHITDGASINQTRGHISLAGAATASLTYCLPNLYVHGFPKSGSTALYNYLTKHSMIAGAREKEVHYLTRTFRHANGSVETGRNFLDAYLKRFFFNACRQATHKNTAIRYIIEGTQSYSWQINRVNHTINDVPAFMKVLVPQAKFIVAKRDPASRAISEVFAFNKSVSIAEAENFVQQIRTNMKVMDSCLKKKPGCCCAYFPPSELETTFPRLHVSMYQCHMARWYARYPRESILELEGHIGEEALKKVFKFLNISVEAVWEEQIKDNEGKRKHEPVGKEVVAELKAFFDRHNTSELVKHHIGSGFSTAELKTFCGEPLYRQPSNKKTTSVGGGTDNNGTGSKRKKAMSPGNVAMSSSRSSSRIRNVSSSKYRPKDVQSRHPKGDVDHYVMHIRKKMHSP